MGTWKLICLFGCGALPALAADLSPQALDILTKRCLGCHGPKTKASGLDLSSRESAIRGGQKGSALKPGAASQSLLFTRVGKGEMPPSAPLPQEERKILEEWINGGAAWLGSIQERRAGLDWWSLQPLKDADPPTVPDAPEAWRDNPIDRWIFARLREKGLRPSAPAGRRTLIRRVTFDLIGLPPTPEEIDAFVRDDSPSAYENVVDRLLASPHYGERWARHWLDVARFSESEGFERDWLRDSSWPYRDYVIRSLNADKPYIQFAKEQLAGDVIEPVTHDGVIATGFLVSGPTDAVGLTSAVARERDAVREDQLEEMVSVVSQTFLGLTANCARCHDHKFDPIPQRDYYRLKAAFAGVWQPVVDRSDIELTPGGRAILTPAEREARERKIATLQARVEAIEEEVGRLHRAVRERLLAARGMLAGEGVPRPVAQWTFDCDARDAAGNLNARVGASGRIAEGRLQAGEKEIVTLRTTRLRRDIHEKTLEAWVRVRKPPDKPVPVFLISNRSGYRGASLDGIQYGGGKRKQWENQSTARFRTADVAGPEENAQAGDRIHLTITYAGDGTIRLYRNGTAYGSSYRPEQDNAAGRLQTYLADDAIIQLTASQSFDLDEARLYDVALSPEQIAASFTAGAPSVPAEESFQAMSSAIQARVKALDAELAVARSGLESLPKPEKAFAADVVEPGVTHVLARGDVTLRKEVVSPGGLTCVRTLPSELGLLPDATDAERRRRIAHWIANPDNPLFSRSIVNRVWHYHFGMGLAENPNDFGYNGGQPSHPELLDQLAKEFIAGGWHLKKLHKRIVMSAAYRQASSDDAASAAKDADNRYIWRFTPRRLEGEAVRDAMLAVSGALNPEAGGPSFQPFLAKKLGGSYVKYDPRDSSEPDLQRRTVYRMNVNSGGDPMLDSLDCPVPSVKTPKRPSTTTPLQALSLMNGPLVLRLSKTFAERLKKETPDPDGQIERAFLLALGRTANATELKESRELVERSGLATLCWGLFNASGFLYVE